MTKSLHRNIIIMSLCTAFAASCGVPQDSKTSRSSSLITAESNTWQNHQYIPICWVNPEDTTQEVLNVFRSTIEAEYTHKAQIYFTGFGKCPYLSEEDLQITPTIRIKLDVVGTTYNASTGAWRTPGGRSYVGLNSGMYSLDGGTWGTRVGAPQTWVNSNGLRTDTLNILVHEIGHALGLEHEHVRGDISVADANNDCSKDAGGSSESGATQVGPYDHNSVMNYCITRNADKSRPFRLTLTDIQGLNTLYPPLTASALWPGQQLFAGQSIESFNSCFSLIMQDDGNLVLYKKRTRQALWASRTYGIAVNNAIMQADGNLVLLLNDGKPTWASNTWNHSDAFLLVQDDGNAVIYARDGRPLWASNTVTSCN